MAQFLRPDSNVTQTGFTGGFTALDETSASDADFAYGADGGGNVLEVGLSNPGSTPVSGAVTLRVRLAEIDGGVLGDGSGAANPITVEIYEGATQRYTTTASPGGAWQTFTFTPTITVTDWNNLRVRISDSSHGGNPSSRRAGGVSWVELETADGATPITGTASNTLDGVSASATSILPISATTSTALSPLVLSSTGSGPSADVSLEYLIVGGGGAGGRSGFGIASPGGGAGGVLTGTTSVSSTGTFNVVVGDGGAPVTTDYITKGGNGGDSSFNGITAIGGGGGGALDSPDGAAGGSGGGGGRDGVGGPTAGIGGSGTAGQGNDGGGIGTADENDGSGGGGGAGTAGQAGSSTFLEEGGNGGDGIASSISGASTYYGGGGGGGRYGLGGLGGGGNANQFDNGDIAPTAGAPNTGGGGGGNDGVGDGYGAAGGSGVVIIRYTTGDLTATGGTITTDGGDTIHTFTSSGTFEVTAINGGGPTPIDGATNATLGAATTSATGTLSVEGTGQASLGSLTADSTAVLAVEATADATLSPSVVTANGQVLVTGDGATTLDDLTSSSVGALAVEGNATPVLAPATVLSTGATTPVTTGTVSSTLDDLTASSAGTLRVAGIGAVTSDALSASSTATLALSGVSAVTLDALTSVSTAALAIAGVAEVQLADLTSDSQATMSQAGGTLTGVSFTVSRGGIDEAPQGVRFTATATGVADQDEVMFLWDFGDDYQFRYLPAETQSNDRQSGTAMGQQAVHAYRTAGTYTVTCTAYEFTSTGVVSSTTSQQITIAASDPRITERVAISLTGSFTGAPAGATQVDWSGGVPSVYALEANKAYYLEAGQTFVMDRIDIDLDFGGCVKLTRYGAGANPVVAAPGTSDHFASLWFRGTDQDDFTISEVDFQGTFDVDDDPDWENTSVYPTPPPNPGTGIYVSHTDNGGHQTGLFFGVRMSGFGINFYQNNSSANSEIYSVDCESTNYFDYGILAGWGAEAFVGVHSTQKIGTQGLPALSRNWNTTGQPNTASHGPMRLSSGDPLIVNKCRLYSYRSGWSGSPEPGVAATQAALRTHTAGSNAFEQAFISQNDIIGGFGIMSNDIEAVDVAQGAVGTYIVEANYLAPNSDGDSGGYTTTTKPGAHYRGNIYHWPSGTPTPSWATTIFLVSGKDATSFASGGTVRFYGETLVVDENMPTVGWQAADQIDDPSRPIEYENTLFQINGTFDSANSDALFQTDYAPLTSTFPFAPLSGSAAYQAYSTGRLPPLEQDGTVRTSPFSIGASEESAGGGATSTSTLGALTSAATGTLPLDGTASLTMGDLSVSGTGQAALDGTSANALGSLTVESTGTFSITATGSASITTGGVSATSTGTLAITGSSTITMGGMVAASGSVLDLGGFGAGTLASATLASEATLALVGTASNTLGGVSSTATGELPLTATAATEAGGATLTATGLVALEGSLDSTLGVLSSNAAGNLPLTGTSSLVLGGVSLEGAGSLGQIAVGNASITLSPGTISSTATIDLTGTGAITTGGITLASAGTTNITGDAAITMGSLTVVAGSASIRIGNATNALGAVSSTSAAKVIVFGAVARALQPATVAADATSAPTGQTSATLAPATMAATGTSPRNATATPTMGALSSTGVGRLFKTGGAAVSLGTLTVSSYGYDSTIIPEVPTSLQTRSSAKLLSTASLAYDLTTKSSTRYYETSS